ncbi:MAG: DHH family phosphoesterase [Candidatus Micrarchaeia archaeon]
MDFQDSATKVGNAVLGFRDPLLVHHYDADGLSAAAIVCFARASLGKKTRTFASKPLEAHAIRAFAGEQELVFVDLGSGRADLLAELDASVAVIDHHPPAKSALALHFNPHEHGYDGARDASASTGAFFCFKHLEKPEIAELGLVGAVGDMQDVGGFTGLNAELYDYASQRNWVSTSIELGIAGKSFKPLPALLADCTQPVLPGLTGDERASAQFLTANRFNLSRGSSPLKYPDLEPPERRRLAAALVQHCLSRSVAEDAVKSLASQAYSFPLEENGTELSDAQDYAALLNACGRNNSPELGINVCLKAPGALESGRAILREYLEAVKAGVRYASENWMDAGAFYLVDGRGVISDKIIGVVASAFLSSGIIPRTKPVLALSSDKGTVKVSARGTVWLAKKGLDLGEALRKAGVASDGGGGGHSVAAGGSYPETREAEAAFLKKAREVIEIQLELR